MTTEAGTQIRWRFGPELPGMRPDAVSRVRDSMVRMLARGVVTKSIVARNQRPLVTFTFDDVPDSAFIYGARVLEDRGVRGTFYISGGLCGTTEPDRHLIDTDDCVELHRRGHEIGCHTFSHPVVQWLDASAFADELDRNREFFQSLVPDLTLENFCFPYGSASLPRKLQAQNRFHTCRGTKAGLNVGTIDLGLLKGTPINDTTDPAQIVRTIDEAVRRNGWLIFFTHDVAPIPSEKGCTPQLLDFAVEAAFERGCEVATVRDALRHLGS